MASVAVIYLGRQLTSLFALKIYGLMLSVVGIGAFVSLTNVFANFLNVARGGVYDVATFAVYAVMGTTLVVQLAVGVGAVALAFLLRDAVRSFGPHERFA